MLPVTGPIVQTVNGYNTTMSRQRYRQAMPVDRPLPYTFSEVGGRTFVDNYTGYSVSAKDSSFDVQGFWGSEYNRKATYARNKAYEKLKAGLGDTAGWLENVAQMGKTRQGIIQRSVQAYQAVSAIKKCRFGDAARILRTPVPSGVSNRKALSQNFLEYEYGWKPLISDLQSSMEILTSDPGERSLYGRAREPLTYRNFSITSTSTSYASLTRTADAWIDARCGAIARITNPNLFLANQLGILDLALPWKLMPFSFVVDWFINVEQVLSSCSDWAGVSLSHQWSNFFVSGSHKSLSYSTWNFQVPNDIRWTKTNTWNIDVRMTRLTSIPGPVLQVKPFKGFSLQRGAQAIALVLAVLGK
jgi:hypothetical protein